MSLDYYSWGKTMGKGVYNYISNFKLHSWELSKFLACNVKYPTLVQACQSLRHAELNAIAPVNLNFLANILSKPPSQYASLMRKHLNTQKGAPPSFVVSFWVLAALCAHRNARILEKNITAHGQNHAVVGMSYRDAHAYFMKNIELFNERGLLLDPYSFDPDLVICSIFHAISDEGLESALENDVFEDYRKPWKWGPCANLFG